MRTKHMCVKGEAGARLVTSTSLSPPVNFLLTVPRRCFFCGSFLLFECVFAILSCLFLAALLSPVGKVLTSWLSCM